jgi:aminoglycoside phosphotransferase (APT) family kinase protein
VQFGLSVNQLVDDDDVLGGTFLNADNMPIQEVAMDIDIVQRMLNEQHPDLASMSIELVANGWDNMIFRLGGSLTVRVPRRQAAAELVRNEQQWLPMLADRLPLPIPAPFRIGLPTSYYPWSWSVLQWLPGATASTTPPIDANQTAVQLGQFFAALHQPAPSDAPLNPFRGVPLLERAEVVRSRAKQMGDTIDTSGALRVWERCLDAPVFVGRPVWLHGDLHPANILVDNGRLSGVIDFGDVTSGDPACDLAVAWMMLPLGEHRTLRNVAGGIDDHTWTRARGWALNLALAYLASSADNPVMQHIGVTTIEAVLSDTELN